MASFMDDESNDNNEKKNINSIYTNICLTLIAFCLVIIAVTSVLQAANNNSGRTKIKKIAICDPQSGRCAKINAGRRLETTN